MVDGDCNALTRRPIRIDDKTKPEEIAAELRERLEALLAFHNGLAPTAEGWRDLALALALQYEPAFQIETPVDRTGRSGSGGKPAMKTFILKSAMSAEIRNGKTAQQAARTVAARLGVAVGTARNAPSRKGTTPDAVRRIKYTRVAEGALREAASQLSRSTCVKE